MSVAGFFLLLYAVSWLVRKIVGPGPSRFSMALHRDLPFPVPRLPSLTLAGFLHFVLRMLGFAYIGFGLMVLLGDEEGFLSVGLAVLLWGWAPWWLVWRVLGPAGWTRVGRGVLFVAGPFRGDRRRGAIDLFTTVYDRDADVFSVERTSPWLAVAAVIREERRGDPERMALLEEGIEDLPRNAPFPRALRVVGGEVLTRLAARRGDWPAVARRARRGRGHGVLLMRLLARKHLGRPVPDAVLWTAWLLAPGRREALPWMRSEIQVREEPSGVPMSAAGPWREHLRLLSDAAAGRPIAMEDVARLAASWEPDLAGPRQVLWIARGLELGARSPSAVCEELRREVLDGLEAMLGAARGTWPETRGEGLAMELGRRCRDRLFDSIHRRVLPFREGDPTRSLSPPMEEWGEWLALRRDVRRLTELCGPTAVATAWHAGLRMAACNWPVYLERRFGPRAMWATHVMHGWSEGLARVAGDEDTRRLSGENLVLARRNAA